MATNHVYMGHPSQIGWFNAINTPLGIDSGVVMGSGDIYALDPVLGSTFPAIPNTVADPDLLAVANSVPPLLPPPIRIHLPFLVLMMLLFWSLILFLHLIR